MTKSLRQVNIESAKFCHDISGRALGKSPRQIAAHWVKYKEWLARDI
jgi:hypothetical protein